MQQTRVTKPTTSRTPSHTLRLLTENTLPWPMYCLIRSVCWNTCLHMSLESNDTCKRPSKHHDKNGVTPRRHGSSGRVAHNAYSVSYQEHVVKFINDFASEHVVSILGRLPRMETLLAWSFHVTLLNVSQHVTGDAKTKLGKTWWNHMVYLHNIHIKQKLLIYRCLYCPYIFYFVNTVVLSLQKGTTCASLW